MDPFSEYQSCELVPQHSSTRKLKNGRNFLRLKLEFGLLISLYFKPSSLLKSNFQGESNVSQIEEGMVLAMVAFTFRKIGLEK